MNDPVLERGDCVPKHGKRKVPMQPARHSVENPPGGGAFGCDLRWLDHYSPLRGCAGLAALAAAKIPRRTIVSNFSTDSSCPSILAIRNPGAGQGLTDLAAAVRLRLRVAIGSQTLKVKSRLLTGENSVRIRGDPPSFAWNPGRARVSSEGCPP